MGFIKKLLGLTPLAIGLGVAWQGNNIKETIQLSQYEPPTEVAQLATDTKMSETGRKIFYLNTPTVEERKKGLNLCKKDGAKEKTVILGCFVSDQGIFIQKVTDRRLAGVMQVTAAHEMLHSAYYRLSPAEKAEVDKQLETAFNSLQNKRIKKLIEIYRKQDPSVVNSELHSILGTEVADLNPYLTTYYQRYFADRSAVVTYAQKYERTFTSLSSQAEEVDRQMKAMKPELDRLETEVKTQSSSIEQQRGTLNRLQASNRTAEYNSRVSSFNRQVDNYNQQVNTLKQRVATYNKLVKTYNALSLEEKSLNESLSSGTN
jgi:phage shock protein A